MVWLIDLLEWNRPISLGGLWAMSNEWISNLRRIPGFYPGVTLECAARSKRRTARRIPVAFRSKRWSYKVHWPANGQSHLLRTCWSSCAFDWLSCSHEQHVWTVQDPRSQLFQQINELLSSKIRQPAVLGGQQQHEVVSERTEGQWHPLRRYVLSCTATRVLLKCDCITLHFYLLEYPFTCRLFRKR